MEIITRELALYTKIPPFFFPFFNPHSAILALDHLYLDLSVEEKSNQSKEEPQQEDIVKIMEHFFSPIKRDLEGIRNITLKAVLYCHTASRRKKIEHAARCVYVNKQHSIALKNARRFILPHRKLLFK